LRSDQQHRDPIEGGGGDVREFSLPPPWPCLPVLSCRSTRPGRRLVTSPRRGETPRFGGRTPAVPPPSLPETPLPDAPRGRLSRYQRWGVARGSRGDGGEVSPTPPHACFPPTDQLTHPKGPRISILPTPTQTRESGGSHAGVASPDPASPTLDYPCQTDVATAGPTSGDQAITSSSLCTAHPTGRCAGPVSPDASSPTATQMTARATRR
jgi:hypothetical protein